MMNLTIAISGMPGAGSSTIGKLLASRLKLKHFSPGQFFKDIGLGNVKNQSYYPLFKNLCDLKNIKIPEFKSENESAAVINLWNSDFGKSKEFHEVLDKLQKKLAERGNIILDGKLSLRMNPDADMKIWVRADIDVRAKRIAEREKIDWMKAKEIIIKREEKERKEFKEIYGFDYFEQEKEADIIIDSSQMNVESIIEVILGDPIFRAIE